MKTKVVQHVPRIIFNVFKVFKFSKFSGSQRLSDFQTFFIIHPIAYTDSHGAVVDVDVTEDL